jgi:hypothetical protein
MGKEYRYRKHIHWGQYAIFIFFFLLFLFMLGVGGFLMWETKSTFMAIPLVILAFIILIGGGLTWFLYYRLAGNVFSVDDNVLIYKYRGGEKRIPIESVRLEFASIRYTGGWLKIIADKDLIRVTVVLEDISGFVQELKAALDNKQLSSHYDSHKLFGFLKTAVSADQSWERAYAIFGKMILLIFVVGIAFLNGYVFASIPIWGLIIAILWGYFSMFWIVIPYTIAEIILLRQIAKKSDESTFTFPQRDLSYEKRVFDKAIMWGGATYFLVSSLVLILVVCFKILFL